MAVDYTALAGQFLNGSRGAPQQEHSDAKKFARAETDRAEDRSVNSLSQASQFASVQGMEEARLNSAWSQHLMDYAQRNYQFEQENSRAQENHDHDMQLKEYAFGKEKENQDVMDRMLEAQIRAAELGNSMSEIEVGNMQKQVLHQEVAQRELMRMLGQGVSYQPLGGMKGAGKAASGAGFESIGGMLDRLANITVTGSADLESQANKLGISPEQLDYFRKRGQWDPQGTFDELGQAIQANQQEMESGFQMGMQYLSGMQSLLPEDFVHNMAAQYTVQYADDPKAATANLITQTNAQLSDAKRSGRMSRATAMLMADDAEKAKLSGTAFSDEDRKEMVKLGEVMEKRRKSLAALADGFYNIFDNARNGLAQQKGPVLGAVMWDHSQELAEAEGGDLIAQFLASEKVGVMQPLSYRSGSGNRTLMVRSSQRLTAQETRSIIEAYEKEREGRIKAGASDADSHVGLTVMGQTRFKSTEKGSLTEGAHFQVVDSIAWGQNESPSAPALRALPGSSNKSVMGVGAFYENMTGDKLLVDGHDLEFGADNILDSVDEFYGYDDAFNDLQDGVIDKEQFENAIDNAEVNTRQYEETKREKAVSDMVSFERSTQLNFLAERPTAVVESLMRLPFFADLPLDPSNPEMVQRQNDVAKVATQFADEVLVPEGGVFDMAYESLLSGDGQADIVLQAANDTMSGILFAGISGDFAGMVPPGQAPLDEGQSRTLFQQSSYAMTAVRENTQDADTTKLLDEYRRQMWQKTVIPAFRKVVESREPSISDFEYETAEGKKAYKEAHTQWSKVNGSLHNLGQVLPGGGYVPPSFDTQDYFSVGTKSELAMGDMLKFASSLATIQGSGPTAGSILTADPEFETKNIHKWLGNLRNLMVSSKTDEAYRQMEEALGGRDIDESVKGELYGLATSTVLPHEYDDMDVSVPYGNGFVKMPMRLVEEYWKANDADNGGRAIESMANRVSRSMADIYSDVAWDTKAHPSVAIRGYSAREIAQVDDALAAASVVLGAGPNEVGQKLRGRMAEFFTYRGGQHESAAVERKLKWKKGSTVAGDPGMMGVLRILPPRAVIGYDSMGDPGAILAAYKGGLGPVAKQASSDRFRSKYRSLFIDLDRAEAEAERRIQQYDSDNSKGQDWRQGVRSQFLINAAMKSKSFQDMADQVNYKEFINPKGGFQGKDRRISYGNMRSYLIALEKQLMPVHKPAEKQALPEVSGEISINGK